METLSAYLVELLVGGFVFTALGLLRSYLKEEHGIKLGKYLDMEAVTQALKYGKRKAKKEVGEHVDAVEFESKALQHAFVFINNQFPRWLKEYGIDADQIRDWLEAKYDDA